MEINLIHAKNTSNKYTIKIPSLGLGVWGIPKNKTEKIVTKAINNGYKHIDTAQIYGNEREVGKAIKDKRGIFITTKVWENNFGYEKTIKSCEESLSKLNKIDLLLMHSPHGPEIRKETWEAMQYLLKNRYVKAIGVSNFGIHHIKEILSWAEIGPCINQIELSPFLQRRELVNFCRKNDIATTAYSPLTHGIRIDDKLSGFKAEETSFDLTLDNQKLIYAYQPKLKVLSYNLRRPLSIGTHSIELTLRDRAGNETTKSIKFDVY